MENNKPQVRFKGFDEDWQLKTLGNLFEITSASRVLKNEWTDAGVPFFRSSDVVSDYKGTDNTKAFISFELYEKLSSISGCVQKNDLLVTGGGSIGIPYLVKTEEPLYFKDADLLWLKSAEKVNGYFLYTFFSTTVFRNYVNSITHIGTISHYTIEQAKATPIIISQQTEQQKIGTFFENLDKLLTEHQQKHSKLKELKSAMLSKMFPQQGQTVPEIRFKGFSGDWEETKIENFADRYDNLRVPVKADKRVKGFTPYYGANGVQDYVEGFTHDGEFILIAEDGANDLKNYPIQYTNGKIWVNNHAHVLQAKGDIANNLYLKYAISQTNIEPFLVGGGRAKLNADTMMKIGVWITKDLNEQKKIANYFYNIDSLIGNLETQISKLQNIKKAFLAKMFI